jgi:hypothetical protein
MWQLIIFTLLFSFSTLAQDSEFFDSYLEEVKAGRVTKSNSLQYVKGSEAKLFKNISNLFDDLQVNMEEVDLYSHTIHIDDSIKQNMNKTLKFLEEDMLNVKLGPSCFSPFRA